MSNYQSPIYLSDWEAEQLLGILAELLEGREDSEPLAGVLEQLYRQLGEETL